MLTSTGTQLSERILLIGDIQGKVQYIRAAFELARSQGISRILQLGDLGVLPVGKGFQLLNEINSLSLAYGIRFDFIDGNHEDFDQLDLFEKEADRAPDGSILVRPNVHWWNRGSVTTIAGIRIGFLGGAVSMDRNDRIEGKSWWPQETLTLQQLDKLKLASADGLDILVTHDVITSVNLLGDGKHRPPLLVKEAYKMRTLIDDAVVTLRPKLLIHGHWHIRHQTNAMVRGIKLKVHGLGSESVFYGIAVLNLPECTVTSLNITKEETYKILSKTTV
jgi:hypothetical protein